MSSNIEYEELGIHLYNLKSNLENTLNIISLYCYKDQRGDYNTPTDYKEINEIENTLNILLEHIKNVQNKIIKL